MEFLGVGRSVFVCLVLVLTSFSPFCLLLLSYSNVLGFVLSYFILFDCYFLKPVCFSLRVRRGVDQNVREGREEPGGMKGGETIIRYII